MFETPESRAGRFALVLASPLLIVLAGVGLILYCVGAVLWTADLFIGAIVISFYSTIAWIITGDGRFAELMDRWYDTLNVLSRDRQV